MKLLIKDNFIDKILCQQLMSSEGSLKTAELVKKDGDKFIKREYRDTLIRAMDSDSESLIRSKILQIRPEIEEKINLNLKSLFDFEQLEYGQGHFFKKHRDTNDYGDKKRRKVTVIIFLNEPGSDNEQLTYQGGTLIIYGLHEKFKEKGLPINAKQGMLLAFPSDLIHEVTPVTSGVRKVIVTWFN